MGGAVKDTNECWADNCTRSNISVSDSYAIPAKNEHYTSHGYYSRRKPIKKKNSWIIFRNTVVQNDLSESDFLELSKKWKKDTAHYSTMFHKLNNSNYLKIIGAGYPAVEFILKDLQKAPELWHEALYFITKINPVKPEDMNDLFKVRDAWLEWGRKRHLI